MSDLIEAGTTVRKVLADNWWIVLLRGIATAILGAFLLFDTGITLVLLVTVLGVFWLVDGVFDIVTAMTGGDRVKLRGWLLFSGILGILAGLFILWRPLLATFVTTTFLVYFIAFQAILGGVVAIVRAVQIRKEIENEWTIILYGVVSIVFGVLLVLNPLISLVALAWAFGALGIVFGVATIILAFRLRKQKDALVAETETPVVEPA